MNGLVVSPGQGRRLVTKAQEITFKVTASQGTFASVFEVVVPPGFDVGAHVHTRQEELFYILEGQLDLCAFEPIERTPDDWRGWTSPEGDRVTRAGSGSCMFVPPGCPHAFTNPTDEPTRVLFLSYPPPDHESYFEELSRIFSHGAEVDSNAVQRLRDRYDVDQITPLRHGTPAS
ncbi:cupin domain-containing protein [Thermomonospora umbrina]|uniref:1,3,6,8-tetrahydroxynaphthalene monooxygenase n=1 Tax=Thermomonospora umbrina TaxID=111806 RepID=A0A3D9SWY8_9ACTN|nr:cupin domain-containing protein [Thermomonospora umbrina]REF00473.1 1,3,6,8-tetrahydroxynaphthalene monooxygenase [Thermomonospora umbrina]